MDHDRRIEDCIRQCRDCHDVCENTLYHQCLEMGGDHVEARLVRLMADCIQACQTAADFMRRGSEFQASQCASCAEICEACAESCERVGGAEMTRCAEACRRCAQSCREMGRTRKAA
ncbi:four-helix bundle copper-binding protein [Tautonia sociabilis]|uniref:Four-helix bundle copper-binding protein n=1 Tax=Tautonia sociabilis TaxID=2080755 RepID=A0A432MPT5_9BACT|nr:four-helix bundle copper-binding protein [Tautonia sociabilis]RUL89481.1 four-helix bundle copper-binding protein [Tautonia sociabilis]